MICDLQQMMASRSFAGFFPNSFETFHWHGDTFSIPDGATQLLQGAGCRNKAFSYRTSFNCTEFHPEL
jgi:GMP synthase-like glutamine amidotransferase